MAPGQLGRLAPGRRLQGVPEAGAVGGPLGAELGADLQPDLDADRVDELGHLGLLLRGDGARGGGGGGGLGRVRRGALGGRVVVCRMKNFTGRA